MAKYTSIEDNYLYFKASKLTKLLKLCVGVYCEAAVKTFFQLILKFLFIKFVSEKPSEGSE